MEQRNDMTTLGRKVLVLGIFFLLCIGGVLFFSHAKGTSVMKNNKENTEPVNGSAQKPLIDSALSAIVETATFALG
jgi:hypothetical protein